ncbi:hypothetical protein [Sinomicrobium sp. M5D2P17]
MKTTIPSITLILLLFTACLNAEKKDDKTTSEEAKTEAAKTTEEKEINLKQNGDYTLLYSPGDQCKLTTAQLAEALSYEENQVEEQSNYRGNCRYNVTRPGGITVNYGVSVEKWPKDIVRDEIKRGLKSEMIDIQVSESGDTYITRHPAQGFLLLLNTDYANPIKISCNYLNTGNPLTDSQKEERKQNTYKIANYLINTYKK